MHADFIGPGLSLQSEYCNSDFEIKNFTCQSPPAFIAEYGVVLSFVCDDRNRLRLLEFSLSEENTDGVAPLYLVESFGKYYKM